MHMNYETAAWRMDMARGIKATDPVRGTVLMHRFRKWEEKSGGKRDFGGGGVGREVGRPLEGTVLIPGSRGWR